MRCPRCNGGPMFLGEQRGHIYRSCLTCGFEPSRADNPKTAEDLRAEVEYADGRRRRTATRSEKMLTRYDELTLKHLNGSR